MRCWVGSGSLGGTGRQRLCHLVSRRAPRPAVRLYLNFHVVRWFGWWVKYPRGSESIIDSRSPPELSLVEKLPSLAVSAVRRMQPDGGVVLKAAIRYIQYSVTAQVDNNVRALLIWHERPKVAAPIF
jgi:hypothetical protein